MIEITNEPKKTAIIKTLAIIGFIVALVFVAWLAVQAVRLVPIAFNTLASIANGLKNKESVDFTIATGTNIINTGETLTISWTQPAQDGMYVFSYKCTNGVVAEILNSTGTLSTVDCNTDVPLTQNEKAVAVIFSSEKSRFVDVPYTIGFTPGGTDVVNKREALITVVNPGISAYGVASNTNDTDGSTVDTTFDTNSSKKPKIRTSSNNATSSQPTVSTSQPSDGYSTIPVVVTTYPVSTPNGYTDLAITFIGVGTYNTSAKTFTPKSSLDAGERAALRFEVKNIGTKTSGIWYFSTMLPTDPAFTYSSSAGIALKPNERQVITLQFNTKSTTNSKRITAAVTGGDDITFANNSFSKEIRVSN